MAEFRNLKVYNEAVDFVAKIYKFANIFPREEKYGLVDQLKRASVSVVLNIAEGSGSNSKIELARFLRISLRSLYEVDAILELSVKLNFCSKKDIGEIYERRLLLGNMLGKFLKTLS